MFIVTIENENVKAEIQNARVKLSNGKINQGINQIDTFQFNILPSNVGFNRLFDFKTKVKVFNTNKNRYEFNGRVLCSTAEMTQDGAIFKSVTCESNFGYFMDSIQSYVEERNWTVRELFEHIVSVHNEQFENEPRKQFRIGMLNVEDKNDNLYCGIQRTKTWDALKDKLLNTLGGEFRLRVENDVNYIDYLKEIGETKATGITLSRNMKSIVKEPDPSAFVTRLIPLGCKLKKTIKEEDEDGNVSEKEVETEERLTVKSVNNNKEYIDVEEAIKAYGIICDVKEFDDVTEASNLLSKGRAWLEENNKLQIKYQITAIDLSLLGLDIDDFEICNKYPLKNSLLGVDDVGRVIGKSLDICEEMKSTLQIGDNFKKLSEIQKEQNESLKNLENAVTKIESNYVTNVAITDERREYTSLINQKFDNISATVSETYISKSELKEERESISSEIDQKANSVEIKFNDTKETLDEHSSKIEEFEKHIKFSNDIAITITGGEKEEDEEEEIALLIDNNKGIVFQSNGIDISKWDGEWFHVGNLIVKLTERAQFGNFAFVPRSNGSLDLLKVGDIVG